MLSFDNGVDNRMISRLSAQDQNNMQLQQQLAVGPANVFFTVAHRMHLSGMASFSSMSETSCKAAP